MLTAQEKVLMIPKFEAILHVSLAGMTDKEMNDKLGELIKVATDEQKAQIKNAEESIKESLSPVGLRTTVSNIESRLRELEKALNYPLGMPETSGNMSVNPDGHVSASKSNHVSVNGNGSVHVNPSGGYRKKSRKSKRKSKARKTRR